MTQKIWAGVLLLTVVVLISLNPMVSVFAEISQFSDDFNSYDEENSAYTSANALISTLERPQTIAGKDGARWRLSNVLVGQPSQSKPGSGWISEGRLAVKDQNAAWTMVNLDLGANRAVDIQSLTVRHKKNISDIRTVTRIMVGKDEKTCFEFGVGRNSDSTDESVDTPTVSLVKKQTPYFLKRTAGVQSEIIAPSGVLWNVNNTTDVDWSISVNGNTISWTVTAGSNSWSASFESTSVSEMMAKAVFPVTCGTLGDGIGYFDNVILNYNKITPSFFDDFSEYNSENSAYTAAELTESISGTAQTIAEGSLGDWKLSGVLVGNPSGNPGGAYVDIGETLAVKDQHARWTSVNLDNGYNSVSMGSLKSVRFRQRRATDVRSTLRILVSEDEKTCFEFGFGRGADSTDTAAVNAVKQRTPYFSKRTASGASNIQSPEGDLWDINTVNDVAWEIWIVGNTVHWKATYLTKVWQSSFTDNNLPDMMSAAKYPVACVTLGDGISYFDDISVSFLIKDSVYVDNGDGTITINIYPDDYVESVTEGSDILVISAFYSNTNELIDVRFHPVTDLINHTPIEITKNQTAGSSGKIFIWDSNLNICTPLAEFIDVN